jgi:hypothetical protein
VGAEELVELGVGRRGNWRTELGGRREVVEAEWRRRRRWRRRKWHRELGAEELVLPDPGPVGPSGPARPAGPEDPEDSHLKEHTLDLDQEEHTIDRDRKQDYAYSVDVLGSPLPFIFNASIVNPVAANMMGMTASLIVQYSLFYKCTRVNVVQCVYMYTL